MLAIAPPILDERHIGMVGHQVDVALRQGIGDADGATVGRIEPADVPPEVRDRLLEAFRDRGRS